jgi:hypothetical protein
VLGKAEIIVEVIKFFALTGGLAFTIYELRRLANQSLEDRVLQPPEEASQATTRLREDERMEASHARLAFGRSAVVRRRLPAATSVPGSSQLYEISILTPAHDIRDQSTRSQPIVLPALTRRGPTSHGRNGWLIEFPVDHGVRAALLRAQYFVVQVQSVDHIEKMS